MPTYQPYTSLHYQFLHPAILSAVSARCLKVERCEKCTHCATCRYQNTKGPSVHVTSKHFNTVHQSQMMPNDARCASCIMFLDQNVQRGSKRLDKSRGGGKKQVRFLPVHQLGFPRESQRTPPRASSGVSVSTAICRRRTQLVQHKRI